MYYGTATDARAYWTARAMTIPGSWTDDAINSALLVVSEWIDGKYETSFSGIRTSGRSQDRAWPRSGAYDVEGYAFATDEFPRELTNATYEAAFRQMTTPGVLSTDYTPSQFKRTSVEGAVSVEFAMFNYASEAQIKSEVIDRAIAPILTGSGVSSWLSGKAARA